MKRQGKGVYRHTFGKVCGHRPDHHLHWQEKLLTESQNTPPPRQARHCKARRSITVGKQAKSKQGWAAEQKVWAFRVRKQQIWRRQNPSIEKKHGHTCASQKASQLQKELQPVKSAWVQNSRERKGRLGFLLWGGGYSAVLKSACA